MPYMRKAERVFERFWALQDMFQDACSEGTVARGDKIKLVRGEE